jgi:hypothetical protein
VSNNISARLSFISNEELAVKVPEAFFTESKIGALHLVSFK